MSYFGNKKVVLGLMSRKVYLYKSGFYLYKVRKRILDFAGISQQKILV